MGIGVTSTSASSSPPVTDATEGAFDGTLADLAAQGKMFGASIGSDSSSSTSGVVESDPKDMNLKGDIKDKVNPTGSIMRVAKDGSSVAYNDLHFQVAVKANNDIVISARNGADSQNLTVEGVIHNGVLTTKNPDGSFKSYVLPKDKTWITLDTGTELFLSPSTTGGGQTLTIVTLGDDGKQTGFQGNIENIGASPTTDWTKYGLVSGLAGQGRDYADGAEHGGKVDDYAKETGSTNVHAPIKEGLLRGNSDRFYAISLSNGADRDNDVGAQTSGVTHTSDKTWYDTGAQRGTATMRTGSDRTTGKSNFTALDQFLNTTDTSAEAQALFDAGQPLPNLDLNGGAASSASGSGSASGSSSGSSSSSSSPSDAGEEANAVPLGVWLGLHPAHSDDDDDDSDPSSSSSARPKADAADPATTP